MHITSRDNTRLKTMIALQQRKGIEKQQYFLLEGIRAFRHAVENQGQIEWIALDEKASEKHELQELIEPYREQVITLDKELYALVSDTVNSQGIVTVCSLPQWTKELWKQKQQGRFLLLDSLQDPGNVGTLIRTADGAGFDGILYTGGTVHPYTPKVNRCAMGSNIYMPLIKVEEEDIQEAQKEGWQFIATALDKESQSYNRLSWGDKVILALGNEGNGLRQKFLDQADAKVMIPLYGKAESLNVAVAGGILMYDCMEKQK